MRCTASTRRSTKPRPARKCDGAKAELGKARALREQARQRRGGGGIAAGEVRQLRGGADGGRRKLAPSPLLAGHRAGDAGDGQDGGHRTKRREEDGVGVAERLERLGRLRDAARAEFGGEPRRRLRVGLVDDHVEDDDGGAEGGDALDELGQPVARPGPGTVEAHGLLVDGDDDGGRVDGGAALPGREALELVPPGGAPGRAVLARPELERQADGEQRRADDARGPMQQREDAAGRLHHRIRSRPS